LFRAGRHVEKFVSLKVEDYIKQNHFYDPIGGKIPDFEAFAKFCANQLVEKKAANVRAFDLEGKNQPCDYSIVASGTSTKHAQSLADHVARMVKDTYGVNPLSHEGQQEGRWVLLDYGALIVHVFYDFVRDEYDLEQLWKGSRRIEV
jgi:nicotinate-nucleotide adenylyltransferase